MISQRVRTPLKRQPLAPRARIASRPVSPYRTTPHDRITTIVHRHVRGLDAARSNTDAGKSARRVVRAAKQNLLTDHLVHPAAALIFEQHHQQPGGNLSFASGALERECIPLSNAEEAKHE